MLTGLPPPGPPPPPSLRGETNALADADAIRLIAMVVECMARWMTMRFSLPFDVTVSIFERDLNVWLLIVNACMRDE